MWSRCSDQFCLTELGRDLDIFRMEIALHEISLFNEATETVPSSFDFTQAFVQYVQQRCQLMVKSMGHCMAYDAAVNKGVSQCLVILYFFNAIKTDVAWYVKRGTYGGHCFVGEFASPGRVACCDGSRAIASRYPSNRMSAGRNLAGRCPSIAPLRLRYQRSQLFLERAQL